METDSELRKKIPLALNGALLANLERHLQMNATGDVDIGKNAINFL